MGLKRLPLTFLGIGTVYVVLVFGFLTTSTTFAKDPLDCGNLVFQTVKECLEKASDLSKEKIDATVQKVNLNILWLENILPVKLIKFDLGYENASTFTFKITDPENQEVLGLGVSCKGEPMIKSGTAQKFLVNQDLQAISARTHELIDRLNFCTPATDEIRAGKLIGAQLNPGAFLTAKIAFIYPIYVGPTLQSCIIILFAILLLFLGLNPLVKEFILFIKKGYKYYCE